MSTIFVTGVSGFAGGYIAERLSRDGHEVFGLIRNRNSNLYKKYPAVKFLVGDLSDAELLYRYINDNSIKQVIHSAAMVSDWGPKEIFFETNVKGTENLLSASRRASIESFFYISTIDVMYYNRQGHQKLNEQTPYSKSKYYYQHSKTLAELKVLLAKEYFKVISIRPAWIFGPGDRTLFPEIIKTIESGFVPLPGRNDIRIPLIYVENLATIIANLVKNIERLPNPLKLNVSDDTDITWRSLVNRIKKSLGKKAFVLNVPYIVCFTAAFLLEGGYRIFKIKHRPVLTLASLPMLASSMEVDNSLMKKYFNGPLINFSEALDRTLDWYQSNPLPKK